MKTAVRIFLFLLIALTQSCTTVYSGKSMASEYFTLAEAYAEVGKHDKAIVYYGKAASVKEYSNAANYGLARSYALTGRWDESARLLSKLLEKDPDNKLLTTSYAFALVSSSQIEEGFDLYQKLWDKYPDDPVMARNYAEMLFVSGKYDEATAQIAIIKEKYLDTEGGKDIATLEKKIADALAPKDAPAEGTEGLEAGTDKTDVQAPESASSDSTPAVSAPAVTPPGGDSKAPESAPAP